MNNAGVAWADSVETFTEAVPPGAVAGAASGQEHMRVYNGVFDTNFKGPVMLTHFAVPHLTATKGAVVNVSSIHSFRVVHEFALVHIYVLLVLFEIESLTNTVQSKRVWPNWSFVFEGPEGNKASSPYPYHYH